MARRIIVRKPLRIASVLVGVLLMMFAGLGLSFDHSAREQQGASSRNAVTESLETFSRLFAAPPLAVLTKNASGNGYTIAIANSSTRGDPFPENEYWSDCFPEGVSCTDTWHFSAVVTVPTAPSTNSGQLIYLWNGLENTGCWNWLSSNNCVLLQPVLEWYEGSYSAFGAFCVGSNGGGNCDNTYTTDTPVTVYPGNQLTLDMWDTSSGANCWNAEVYDSSLGTHSSGLNDNCQHNWGYQFPIAEFALEVYYMPSECPHEYYPSESSSYDPNDKPGDWVYFNDASINSGFYGGGVADDNACTWEANDYTVGSWAVINMPS